MGNLPTESARMAFCMMQRQIRELKVRMENSMVIISKAIPNAIWDIDRQIFYANNSKNRMLKHSVEIMRIENEFIRNYNPVIHCNDLTGENWCFDTKLPSGGWLENIRVTTNESGCQVFKALILC